MIATVLTILAFILAAITILGLAALWNNGTAARLDEEARAAEARRKREQKRVDDALAEPIPWPDTNYLDTGLLEVRHEPATSTRDMAIAEAVLLECIKPALLSNPTPGAVIRVPDLAAIIASVVDTEGR